MKIAVTSTGPTLDDQVEARFGRCAYFLIGDPDSMHFEAVENPNIALGGGAGIQSAQLMAETGVSHILTGNCGPNAFDVFGQAGVQVIVGMSGAVREAVERFKAGQFTQAEAANVQSHFGTGAGPGMGTGGFRMGGGRGMGQTKGMGFGAGWKPWIGQGRPDEGMGGTGAGTPKTGRKAVALVRPERCAGCGICTDVCPTGAIRIVQQQAVVEPELCTACAACVSECPNEAIVIIQQKLL